MFWKLFGIALIYALIIFALLVVGIFTSELITKPRRIRKEKARDVIRWIWKEYW